MENIKFLDNFFHIQAPGVTGILSKIPFSSHFVFLIVAAKEGKLFSTKLS
jgi:hypothetical protein